MTCWRRWKRARREGGERKAVIDDLPAFRRRAGQTRETGGPLTAAKSASPVFIPTRVTAREALMLALRAEGTWPRNP